MFKWLLTISGIFWAGSCFSQYYIRGEVRNEENESVQNVKIYRPSTKSIFYSGSSGGFGIPSSSLYDSLVLSKEGYDSVFLKIRTDEYQRVILKPAVIDTTIPVRQMISFTTGIDETGNPISVYHGETYSNLIENGFVTSKEASKTTLGIRIDKASYSNIRRFINQEMEVPPDAVRIDEVLNYFNLNNKEPQAGKNFGVENTITDCPWDARHKLLYYSLSAAKLNTTNLPPSNFVFLIDVSASMDMPNRLPLLKEAFQLFVNNLRDSDTISIVTYGGTVGIWLTPTGGAEKEKIINSIEALEASGDTPGESAIRTAYKLIKSTFIRGGNNRIILATDGDFNIGISKERDLEKLIEKEKENDIYLTCLGVGMGNYKDSKIEVLAKKGNGNFAYIDNIDEAEKVLMHEFTQTMYAVADNVYATVSFNPDFIEKYRLIGYDNKKSELKNFKSIPLTGQVGSGSGNTILFEIETTLSDSAMVGREIGSFTIHYTDPGHEVPHNQTFPTTYNYQSFATVESCLKFATALAMYSLKIKTSQYFPEITWDEIRNIAAESARPDSYLQQQFVRLIDDSKKIYTAKKRKKR